eukprot:GILI01023602.1.p2 GENE.GILI01023602.1~~GILI01023602.1.p2  ORF type:complete len:236 (+),score=69.85 GILI01023602.1:39-746(+)
MSQPVVSPQHSSCVRIESPHPYTEEGDFFVSHVFPEDTNYIQVDWVKHCDLNQGYDYVTFFSDETFTTIQPGTCEGYTNEANYVCPKFWDVPLVFPGNRIHLKFHSSSSGGSHWGFKFTANAYKQPVQQWEVEMEGRRLVLQVMSVPRMETVMQLLDPESGQVLSPWRQRGFYTGEVEEEYDGFSDWPTVIGTRRVTAEYKQEAVQPHAELFLHLGEKYAEREPQHLVKVLSRLH